MNVLTVDLSAFVRHELPRGAVRLMKMDVEGAELRALRGARATLRSARPLLVFENNHLSNDTQYGTAALLEAHGYVKTNEVEHNEVWAPSLVQSGRRLRRPRRSRPVLL